MTLGERAELICEAAEEFGADPARVMEDFQEIQEEIYEKLRLEVRAAFDTWQDSGYQKHSRAVFRNLEKVYARITGREFVR